MRKENFVLKNGVKIPCIGYGTWKTESGITTYQGVRQALEQGYRHIDTAYVYKNEESVGEALRDSGISRKELFVTTKQWVTRRGYEDTIRACEEALKSLKLDYLDLYLIHWPCVEKYRKDWKELNAETWRGFERLYQEGKVRAIGVSNFQKKHLEALKPMCSVFPMVDQIEFHPGYLQLEDVRYMQSEEILPEAWSPLGNGNILQQEELCRIAGKYGKTTAQICVRFCLQEEVLPLTKSLKPERMRQNREVFDFELAEEDIKDLEAIPLCGFTGLLPENAPHDIRRS